MKKELAVFTLALGLASTAPAFADGEKITAKKQPVKMTEQQLDQVAGGLITIIAPDAVDVNNNRILNNVLNNILRDADVAVNAAAAILGTAGAAQGVLFCRAGSCP